MIYHVEDEKNIRDLVVYTLRLTGYEALGLTDGRELRAAMEQQIPDLILLDVMLPGEDGFELLRWLRSDQRFRHIPVLMLTARGSESDTVEGLDDGADDYLPKPFSMMELIARIKAILRRCVRERVQMQLVCGNIEIDTAAHSVKASGEAVSLTHKEYSLLLFLMQNAGKAFDREQLLRAVWGEDYFGGTRTVDVHIQTLRQKLNDAGGQIETIYGLGYKMNGSGS